MKKQPSTRIARHLSRAVAVLLLISALGSSLLFVTAYAEDAQDQKAYEAKKLAWRKALMEDDVTTDDLLIGSWVSFYSFEVDSYEEQLDQMAAAGINFNMFPKNFGSGHMFDEAYWSEIEAQYAKRNMVYHMNGSMRESNIAPGVEFAAGKEHCVGYHVVDEPTADRFSEIAHLIRLYREADELRYPMVNLFPSYAPEWALGGSYEQHVAGFVETIGAENIEYLSHDYYPFRAGGVVMDGIFADMEVLRRVAYENGKLKTHAFPQSTAWNGTRMPTVDEMRWNVYGYLAYGFKALSWFNLVCPGSSDTEGEGFRESLIYRDGSIQDPQLFAAFSDLNWEVRGLSAILMNQDVVHAYHNRAIAGVEQLPEDYFIRPKGQRSEFIISVMEPKEGEDHYIMIFNKNLKRPTLEASFQVDLTGEVKWLEYFDPFIGEYIPVEITDGVMTEPFRAGEGRVYRLRTDEPPVTETTEEVTEMLTETPAETLTETPTETLTETPTETLTETFTETPAEPSRKGCSSTLTVGWGLLLLPTALVLARRRRRGEP